MLLRYVFVVACRRTVSGFADVVVDTPAPITAVTPAPMTAVTLAPITAETPVPTEGIYYVKFRCPILVFSKNVGDIGNGKSDDFMVAIRYWTNNSLSVMSVVLRVDQLPSSLTTVVCLSLLRVYPIARRATCGTASC